MADSWNKRDEELALCIAFLKLGARVASDLRDRNSKGLQPEPQGLTAIVSMALTAFPNLEASNAAIEDLGHRCGFDIEERTITQSDSTKPS